LTFIKRISYLLCLSILTVSIIQPIASEAAVRNIRVGLASNAKSLVVSSTSSYTISDRNGRKISVRGNLHLSASKNTTTVTINEKKFGLPLTLYGKGLMTFNKRKYRGNFKILRGSSGLTLINELGIENYLRGVLKMEINPAWPREAIKAQAVISRTYALKHLGKHSKEGFDLCALPHCQVYRGVNAEDPVCDKAIRETRGSVLTFQGKLALTPFHSDCGGATADVSTVWGGHLPYLKAVREPVQDASPYASWKAMIKTSDIQNALRKKGISIGTVTGIGVTQHDPYGRADQVRITGTGGSHLMSSHSFRMAIGSNKIRSTMFTISSSGTSGSYSSQTQKSHVNNSTPAPDLSFIDKKSDTLNSKEAKLMTVLVKQGFFNADQMIDMLLHPEKKKAYLVQALERKPISREVMPLTSTHMSGNEFIFTGKGWGHGVGMSQWGAKALAEKGWSEKRILDHYFPGTKLTRYY